MIFFYKISSSLWKIEKKPEPELEPKTQFVIETPAPRGNLISAPRLYLFSLQHGHFYTRKLNVHINAEVLESRVFFFNCANPNVGAEFDISHSVLHRFYRRLCTNFRIRNKLIILDPGIRLNFPTRKRKKSFFKNRTIVAGANLQ
jgi:hypothetical protein